MSRIVVISDHCTLVPPDPVGAVPFAFPQDIGVTPQSEVRVIGGYLERLPLAWLAAGHADQAEIWSFAGRDEDVGVTHDPARLTRRVFRADARPSPWASQAILDRIATHGAPETLCVWGLGVDESILDACRDSIRIYNSIDAPSIRIPENLSRHFDIFLTGAEWQSAEIRARHPDALIEVLPIGPEFASAETFRPLGVGKEYDVIYVAAAQPYKRHDLLFSALRKLPRDIRALCVMGYGELADEFRKEAAADGLAIDFVGPPGVSHDEVNVLMNRAKVGVVCGVDDGAPAILTEYMLAGLPVLANAGLRCGLQYILPDTGRIAAKDDFAVALAELIATAHLYSPREVVLRNWAWPHSVARLGELVAAARVCRL